MAWRIFGKDLILLWPWLALSAAVQFALASLMYAADRNPDVQSLLLAARLFVFLAFLVDVLVIALAVHQDAIPGTRQDWLVRPIRRADLLLAKLLFVLAAIQLPMFLADLAEALAQGLPWTTSTTAALEHSLYFLIAICLPALGLAALTRNMAQFVGAGVAYFISVLAVTFILSSTARLSGQEQATNPLAWTGVAWIPDSVASAILALGMLIVIALLYFRRKVTLGRLIAPVFVAVSVAAVLLPWSWIFAIQAAASAAPSQGRVVDLVFDASAPPHSLAPGENVDDYAMGAAQVQLRGRSAGDIVEENRARRAQGDVTLFLPLRTSGLPAGSLLWADRALITLTGADGKVVFRGRGEPLQIRQTPGGPVTAYQAVRLPALLFESMKDKPLRLHADYSLTLFRPRPPVDMAALGGDGALAGVGRCSTERDSDGDDIVLRCLKPGRAPSCVSVTLEDPASGRRNPDTLVCAPDYSPYNARPFPDSIARFEVETPFRDRLGLAAYPVGGRELASARVALTVFHPEVHFTRSVSGTVRPADWTAHGGPAS